MKPYTAKQLQAIDVSIDLWTFLRDNPGKHKHQWPRYTEVSGLTNRCALCTVFGVHCTKSGVRCPLLQAPDNPGDCDLFVDWQVRVYSEPAEACGYAAMIVQILEELRALGRWADRSAFILRGPA
mgnify:CR=1 FL=1